MLDCRFEAHLMHTRLRFNPTLSATRTRVIHSPPEVVHLAVDFHENLVEMPPLTTRPHPLDTAISDLGGEHRTKPVPPEPNRLVADVNAALVQKIFDVSKGKRTYIINAKRMIS